MKARKRKLTVRQLIEDLARSSNWDAEVLIDPNYSSTPLQIRESKKGLKAISSTSYFRCKKKEVLTLNIEE